MALDNFKKIENNKGYLVEDKDRKIFEREISKGYFGMNIGDTIEFVLYDSNDNPLPQESAKGNSVRYIEYNDDTKKEYFGKSQVNQNTKSPNDSEEFFIDTEKLIKEAGYTNGVFKTQVSLLNRRLGSDENEFDKLWIHEISPSRTEIRILPTVDGGGKPNSDLSHRYDLFVNNKTFLPDVYPFIDNFIQQFDVQKALESLLTLKGKVSEGQNYIKLIEQEFKIPNIETYLKNVQDKFIESATHFKEGREYDITSSRYGLPKETQMSLDGDINRIYNIIIAIIGQCVEFYLPKRDIKVESSLTLEQQKTLDELQKLQKTQTSDGLYKTTEPESISRPSVGCKNPDALNYNPNVDVHDEGLCEFVSNLKICNDPNATNFGQVGECQYTPPPLPKVCNDPKALNYGQVGICIYDFPDDNTTDEITTPIDYFDDRVDIPDTIVVDDITFPITPLPIDIAGGSPVSGEGEQGNPSIGGGGTREIPVPGQEEVVIRTKKTIYER